MSKKAKIKVWFKSISALAFAMAIIVPVMQSAPAVAAEVFDVDAGPGVRWIEQEQSGNPEIQVHIGDILVFNQASVGIPHGLMFDMINIIRDGVEVEVSPVQRCDEPDNPDALFVELPPCEEELSGVELRMLPLEQNEPKKTFVLLRVVKRFTETITFRCLVHSNPRQMEGTVVMH